VSAHTGTRWTAAVRLVSLRREHAGPGLALD